MTNQIQSLRGTVLLAEEDVLLRSPIAQYLRDCGYKVIEATSAHEAKLALGDTALDVSIVVTAVRLAGDGFGISNWAKRHRPDVKITIFASARKAVEVAAGLCSEGGASRLNGQTLLRRVQRMLSTRNRPPHVA